MNTLELMSNAVSSHQHGLEALLMNEIFYALPTAPVLRSLAEVAATISWMLEPGLAADDRAVRGYALLFLTIGQNKFQLMDANNARELIAKMVIGSGGKIQRRVVQQRLTEDVGRVRLGRAHAKTAFKYQHRFEQ